MQSQFKKIILKSFTEGVKICNREKDTFLKSILKESIELIVFDDSAFSFFQKFNFGSDIILKDISKYVPLKYKKSMTSYQIQILKI